ncbi:asparagine synthase (glutamine-hydrolysing) [Nonomuraea solani]|uniref:asparagine synthase (glutamine-hydrolyzing) n=1 Tax=Nonomuraea solani TaxID=1144553 RepID=A0A1H6ET89_9ACTN|nr:albusnodin/ikarugamycin family macrolactam cyclase [Nonomuraea solani]SEH00216.1 asparagine synthase (glutamine-hydrolysing) [Nonomuraea solani]
MERVREPADRWFVGCAPITNEPPPVRGPRAGKVVWNGPSRLWLGSQWPARQVWTAGDLVVLGDWISGPAVLRRKAAEVLRSGRHEDLLTSAPGDFNLLIREPGRLRAYSDVSGQRAIYYRRLGDTCWFANSTLPLAWLEESDLDLGWFTGSLMCPWLPDLLAERSPFREVRRVPAGGYLEIGGGTVRCLPYWRPPGPETEPGEAARLLRERLTHAVEARADGSRQPTADLSGGMDSTALTLLAARRLAADGRSLTTVTYGSAANGSDDDLALARRAAAGHPNIDSTFLPAELFPRHFSDLDAVPLTGEPALFAYSYGRFRTVMEVARAAGSDMHLDGEGGDAVLVPPLGYLADLIRRRELRTALAQARGWAQVKSFSTLHLFATAAGLGARPYRRWVAGQREALRDPVDWLSPAHRQRSYVGWSLPSQSADWFTPEARLALSEEVGALAARAEPYADTPGQHGSIVEIWFIGRICQTLREAAQANGVSVHYPFLDAAVIEACLASRIAYRGSPFAAKPLLRDALAAEFPHHPFDRSTKGDYNADIYAGLAHNMDRVLDLVSGARVVELGLVDGARLAAALNRMRLGLPMNSWLVNGIVGMEVWLRALRDQSVDFWS